MPQLEPQLLTDLSNGYISKNAVFDTLMPSNTVSESINFDFDRIGAAQIRKGTTLLGSQISDNSDILGLYEFRDSGTGTNNQLLAVNDTVCYYFDGANWASKRINLTTGQKAEFTTFLDYIFMVNGQDATMTWDGNTGNSFSTTNVVDAPVGISIEVYKSRAWIGNATDRVYYSSLPDASTNAITWDTSATGNWIDISPQDGDNLTKLKRTKNALLVFKRNHIYRIYSVQETEPDPKINVGTYSGRSVVEAKDGIYFHHPTGIYRYSDGVATDISQPIIDFIENISASNYSSIAGWTTGNHVYFSVGNVTIGDVTYSNVVIRYTISSKVWTIRSYPTKFLAGSSYNDGTTLYTVVGDNDGNVFKFNYGNDDNGTPIFYSLITKPYTLDGSFTTRKHITKMAVIHEKAEGAKVEYRVDDYSENRFDSLTQIKSRVAKPFTSDIKGNKIWFRVSGTSVGERFTIGGFEILEATNELIG